MTDELWEMLNYIHFHLKGELKKIALGTCGKRGRSGIKALIF
jgi:hypothetical protein